MKASKNVKNGRELMTKNNHKEPITEETVSFSLENVPEPTTGHSVETYRQAGILYNGLMDQLRKVFAETKEIPQRLRVKSEKNLTLITDNQGFRAFFRENGINFSTRTEGTILMRFKPEIQKLLKS